MAATPKQIRELMKVDGITNDEVKSHLFLLHCDCQSRIGEFLLRVEVMGGCILTMRGRAKLSQSRPSSKSGYPQAHLPASEETQSYYNSLIEVIQALEHARFESSNLIVGIDFTKSNEWTGGRSFNKRSLHHIGDCPNPYEQAISIIGKTLARFDEDNLIPCFGFGDATTHDEDVFSFYPDDRLCNGFEEVLTTYREIVPFLKLAGPTSFAPIIQMAMSIVEKSGGQFHVLLIITSGQLGVQKQKTIDAIVEASNLPLSIILVGVGDGPWDIMKRLGDSTCSRAFDNLHFVNFTDIVTKNVPPSQKKAEFTRATLMKIPSQYIVTKNLSMAGGQTFKRASPAVNSANENEDLDGLVQDCLCASNSVNMVLYCGHQICSNCKPKIYHCPYCRIPVGTKDYKLMITN
ncbi:E3 ubiquitin-protein ligase RGLG1 isoform X3 [Pyrus x bretschneideri]|nr:E3 ubiquitin-protein ligase RGLG1 isoform X3 [Pyrus x bretschneideri]XP_048432288.1 E3 ubiquitin-protein ligase RGLG1 isoform X3 [Pyrus x bretschneideri]